MDHRTKLSFSFILLLKLYPNQLRNMEVTLDLNKTKAFHWRIDKYLLLKTILITECGFLLRECIP